MNDRVFRRDTTLCASAVTPAPTVPTPCTSPLATNLRTVTGIAPHGAKFNNLAVFGNVTLNVSEQFRLIGGLRLTNDKLDVYHSRTATNLDLNALGQPVNTGGINTAFGPFTSEVGNHQPFGPRGHAI